ncbi:uncharacterized protein LOC120345539 [Styela clava]|uniref:uncharacterized protein LOC120345539 n=1 Tax=Styela clava TaxID=7725 RepID=UPI001939AC75|nr:uncharacterized protein LOC120345539 [Styela clava]
MDTEIYNLEQLIYNSSKHDNGVSATVTTITGINKDNSSVTSAGHSYINDSSSVITDRNSAGWIFCQTVTLFFTVISLYITLAITWHRYKSWKEVRMLNGNEFVFSTNVNTISSPHHNNNNKNTHQIEINNEKRRQYILSITSSRSQHRSSNVMVQTALELLTIASAVFVTLRSASEQLKMFLSDSDKNTCNIIADVYVLLYAFPIATIYSFLWLRQRILYFQKPLSAFNSKKVRMVSAVIFGVMLIGEIATTLVFTLTITYKPGELGCSLDKTILPDFVPWMMIIVFTVSFQIVLLGLYIGPLICISMKNNAKNKEIRRHGNNRIGGTIKRVCIATFACLLSDMVAVLVTYSIKISIVSNLIYDLNLIVNLIGIICSFKNWRNRLFPIFCFRKATKNQASQRTIQ